MGRITGKRVEGDRQLVGAEIWITNQRHERSAIETAAVQLPSRANG